MGAKKDWLGDAEALDVLPRLGWVEAPTPISELRSLAEELGLEYLGVKRDDLSSAWLGGTKVRKLDLLLASERYRDATRWASAGAIGSGHLVALSRAAEKLDRRLDAFVFWTDPTEGCLRNLAATASGPTTLHFYANRLALLLARPTVIAGGEVRGVPVIPPGASAPEGVIALALAGLELARQVAAGELPAPDRVYVPYGTGGTAAGLSIGLGLGGLACRVHAVAATERVVATQGRLERLRASAYELLRERGVDLSRAPGPVEVVIDRSQLGRGYGRQTRPGVDAVELLAPEGLALEPVYSGKAMAALLADARRGEGGRALFWMTPHGVRLPDPPDDLFAKLPDALARRLRGEHRISRRRALIGLAAAVGLGVWARVGLYPAWGAWRGKVLSDWEAHVVASVAEALVPDTPGGPIEGGVAPRHVAENVDRFLVGMPEHVLFELHGLMAFVEHGTLLGGHARRFTRLSATDRLRLLQRLGRADDERAVAARAIRDLCLLGTYKDPRTWASIGYEGPPIGAEPASRYDALCAPAGVPPSLREGRA